MTEKLPAVFADRIARISDEELAFRGWTRDGMHEKYLERMEVDKNSPRVGDMAPDFELEMLASNGSRTGEYKGLHALRGRPVGLIFGSYT